MPEIVLAPMAGGPSTVDLAVAVCEAGGLGFLAAGYLTAETMEAQVRDLRARTSAPFAVNMFVIEERLIDQAAVDAYLRTLEPDAARVRSNLAPPRFHDDEQAAKITALVDLRVPIVSFTFACPQARTIAALQSVGTRVWVSVTSLAEARLAAARGADVLVAQGSEAGGHRGAFEDDGGEGALGVDDLTRELTARLDLPVVAAGGVATAADVSRCRGLGAAAVQVGTAFLLADEAGTSTAHREAVASERPTAFTRAFTGRTARGIVNQFMVDHPAAPAAFPQIHHATAPMRAAARLIGDGERLHLWAGTRHALATPGPAGDIVRSLLGRR